MQSRRAFSKKIPPPVGSMAVSRVGVCDGGRERMPAFVRLLNSETYLPGLWDLRTDPEARRVWAERLRENMGHIVDVVRSGGDAGMTAAACRAEIRWREFLSCLDEPEINGEHPTVHHLTKVRDGLLREEGVPDAYHDIKQTENERSLALYRDESWEGDGIEEAFWGVFAGNVFDLASPSVAADYHAGRLHFPDLVRRARERPLAIDDRRSFREALASVLGAREPTVVILVDNAGMDFVLGCVPLAGEFLAAGCRVVLAANELPSLNDITADEAGAVLREIAACDPRIQKSLGDGILKTISTGNASPGIDFRRVSDALNAAAEAADLLVIEGQGRAIETTWTAQLSVPTLRLATLKSPIVSRRLGLEPYDLIFDFRPADEQPPERLD